MFIVKFQTKAGWAFHEAEIVEANASSLPEDYDELDSSVTEYVVDDAPLRHVKLVTNDIEEIFAYNGKAYVCNSDGKTINGI